MKTETLIFGTAFLLGAFLTGRSEPLDEWHWRNPLPQGNLLNSVAYGNGTFVAIGTYGTILTSSDGIQWTRQNAEVLETFRQRATSPRYLYEIIYGDGLFVAVGGGSDETQGLVLTSHDGVNWGITWLSGARLYAATYAEGRFMAVGTHGKGFTSLDGLDWAPMDTGHDASLSGISFGSGKWLAVGGSTLVISADGANWNVHTNGPPVGKVAYGNSLFAGVSGYLDGAGYNIATSPDGVSWTWRRSGEIENLPGIAYASGKFVAVGPGSVVVSADGTNWTRWNAGILRGFRGIAGGPGRLVAVGSQGAIVSSADGVTWNAVSQGPIDTLRGVTFDGRQFVAVATTPYSTNNSILTSLDGVSWKSQPSPTIKPLNGIAHGGGAYVSVGDGGTILRSADGITWLLAESPTSNTLFAVTYANSQFTAVGYRGTAISSSDGINWTPQLALTEGNLRAVTYGGGQFVAVGKQADSDPRELILTSVDGTVWEPLDVSPDSRGELRGVAYGNGVFVAVGNVNLITSPDGVTWTRHPMPSGVPFLYAITFVDGQFVAAGPGHILTSPDGEAWKKRDQSALAELNAVAAGADTVVVVGNDGTILQSGFLTRPVLSNPTFANGMVEFSLTGKTGAIFRIQSTSDLTSGNWADLGSVTNSIGSIRFVDPNSAQSSSRFYRAVVVP